MKSELVPLDGGPAIRITRDVTIIGRREYCDVAIDHPSLSRRHCVLVRTDGLLVVRDLITTNGTKVNGQRVASAALLPDDRLTLGRMKYRVYLGPDDSLSPSETAQVAEASGSAQASIPPAHQPAAALPPVQDFAEPSDPQLWVMPIDDPDLPPPAPRKQTSPFEQDEFDFLEL